jgi:hypothetical protein
VRRKIAMDRLSFPRRGEGEFFLLQKSACSQPLISRLRLATARQAVLSPCARGEAERIAVALTLGGIRRLIVLSIVKAFGIEE